MIFGMWQRHTFVSCLSLQKVCKGDLPKIKHLEQKAAFQLQSKFQQKAFSSNFWKFSENILKANQEPIIPSFDESSAFHYFSSAYWPKHHLSFNHPKWLKRCENPTDILGSPAVSFKLVSKKTKAVLIRLLHA